jgi:hypothetical protein
VRGREPERVAIEGLEARALLSATFYPDIEWLNDAAGGTTVSGYTPAQVRRAYGFDQVRLGDGSVAADGAGQTIAIIDAFNHPNIASDLNVFSTQFALPAADLKVVNQTGGTRLPATDAGWAGEIALDVEWAHAIAPAASILLVEANSAQDSDLMAAVDYARHAAGVSVISMSWGGSEYFSFRGDESSTQLAFDQTFTTPAAHPGVTFIASAGDSGFNNGVQWPASSPNVIAVGGTSLQTQDAAGTYLGEGPWRGVRSGTSGGFSQVEPEPAYQQAAQQSGARSTPDVGYNGDPNTGFAVYDSVAFNGSSGWDVVGGTSAGAPQWAALVAIANQGRALAGRGSLDGPTGTLPDLYGLYRPPGTADYSTTYTAAFNDIGADGYGYTTGLGTPKAAAVVNTLVGTSSSDGGDTGSGGGTAADPTTPAPLPASPLTVAFSTDPAAGIGGENTSARLRLTNSTANRFSGPVTVSLYASTDATVSSDDAVVTTLTLPKLTLRGSASRTVKLKATLPDNLPDGSYVFIASADAAATGTAPAEAATVGAVAIESPKVDLATTFAGTNPIALSAGRGTTTSVTIRNTGNVLASGTLGLTLYGSADATLDDADAVLTSLPSRKIRLRPGRSVTIRVHLPAPGGADAGTGYVLASASPSTNPPDDDASNNVAAAPVA